ncbi:MAG: ribonuclease HI [Bacteroidia bacterium]|nr:ribonuclease HI [Bacteroidia bacterium]
MTNAIEIYTDGACSGNPGPGGYGIVMKFQNQRKELSQGFKKTTNNRMELLAVIIGLESIKKPDIPIIVYSDSKYVVDAINLGWVNSWLKKGFKDKANPDLWQRFLKIHQKYQVKFVWVKGHAENIENNRCDELAVNASKGAQLLIDEGYENNNTKTSLF